METPAENIIKYLAPEIIKCPDPESEDRMGMMEMVIATTDVADRQNDVFVKGCVGGRQEVLIGGWNHALIKGSIPKPLGVGTVYEEGNKIKCDVELNMELQEARDLYSSVVFTLKKAPHLVEASFGARPVKRSPGTMDGKRVQKMELVSFKEASTAIVGVGYGTGVISVKSEEIETPVETTEETKTEETEDIQKSEEFLPTPAFVDIMLAIKNL